MSRHWNFDILLRNGKAEIKHILQSTRKSAEFRYLVIQLLLTSLNSDLHLISTFQNFADSVFYSLWYKQHWA